MNLINLLNAILHYNKTLHQHRAIDHGALKIDFSLLDHLKRVVPRVSQQ
jgi:hypothetical protein